MKGRTPIPKKIKELRGNPSRQKLRAEPEFGGVAECPDWLSDVAKAE